MVLRKGEFLHGKRRIAMIPSRGGRESEQSLNTSGVISKGMPAHPPPPGARLVSTRVLVVDDDYDSAEVVSEVLTREGCEVRFVLDAQEALRTVTEFTPEIVLLDIGLPGADGYELLAAFAKHSRPRYLPLRCPNWLRLAGSPPTKPRCRL